jgi:flagellar hook-associated protein 1 FlgK
LSTFSGLSGALSSLYAQRRGLDVTGQNIANANTAGYSRQRVDMQSVNGSVVPALFSTPDGTGGGVTVTGVTRVQDAFLEARGRLEHAQSTYLSDQNSMYARVEAAFGEPSDHGLQSQLSAFGSSLHELANQPGDAPARTQVLARATTVADSLHTTSTTLASLFSTTREQFDTYTTEVNTTATQVAQLNQAVVSASQAGQPSNELADRRDALVVHLSELTGATALTRDNGAVDVFLGGSGLVNGPTSRQIVAGGANRLVDVAATPVTLQWADSGAAVGTESGQAASMLKTMNTILPAYQGSLDQVAATFAGAVNTQHIAGYDLNGDPGTAMFDSSDGQPINAQNIIVVITDPSLVAAAGTSGGSGSGTLDGGNADQMAGLGAATGSADKVYRQLVVDLGVAAQAADRRASAQTSVTNDVDSARQAQTGVNLDEEMTNLMSYQRAYQAASRVINVVDSTLDTLINHTGS